MRNTDTVVIVTSLALFASLALAGCGGGKDLPVEDLSAGQQSGSLALSAAIAEVETAVRPETVSEHDWSMLTEELVRVLSSRGLERLSSAIPPNDKALIGDFTAEGDASQASFSWSYRNAADYDQNGEVNIADLTTIAVHLFKTPASPDWNAARLADGDNNGEVNLADITPLGLNFANSVAGYRLENSADGVSGWNEVAVVNVADGSIPSGGGVKQFSYSQSGVPEGSYRVVPVDKGLDGPPSNVAALVASDPSPGDWSQPGGGPQNLNNTPVSGPASKPGDSITEVLLPALATAMVLGDNFLYALNNADQLEKRDTDGNIIWTYAHPSRIRSFGLGSDGVLYLASTNCTVFALSGTGQLLWEYTLVEGEIPSFAAVHPGGNVIFWITEPAITLQKLPWTTQVLMLDSDGGFVEQQQIPDNNFENEVAIAPDGRLFVALQGEPTGKIATYGFDGSGTFSEMDAPGKVEAGAGRSIVVSDWDLIYLDAGGGQGLQVLDLDANLQWSVAADEWQLGPSQQLYIIPAGDTVTEVEVYDNSGALVESHDFATGLFDLGPVSDSGRVWVRSGNPEFGIKSVIPGIPATEWYYPDLIMSLPSIDADDNFQVIVNGLVTSLDPSGQLRWQIEPAAGGTSGAMAQAADGTVYVPLAGRMQAYSAGLQLKWDTELLAPVENHFINPRGGPAILSDGSMAQSYSDFISGAPVAHVFVVKPAGAEEWHAEFNDYWPSQVRTGSDDTVYVLLTDRVNSTAPLLKALRASDGMEKWSVDLGGANGKTIADYALAVLRQEAGDLVYCSNSANSLFCYDASGNEQYSHDSGWSSGAKSVHVLGDGSLLALQNSFTSADLLLLDPSGNESWSQTFATGLREIAVSGDGAYIGATDSDFTKGLDPADGSELWSQPNEVIELVDANGFPVFDGNGNLFVKRAAELNCYDPADGSLLWSYLLYGKYGVLSGETINSGAPLLHSDGSVICALEGNHLMKILP
ncbi:MAG: PQQ-binding-like beta-propeller repeat protein [Planctomycetales bacterium]|nr:PQQ-binding-like beta-propeller repeat protein [bacterium]UNM09392.1 MAG: PQQ-binding-like beta-propeller repeat protein [Planctomycetales bacterium]